MHSTEGKGDADPADGKWAAVAELHRDSFGSFPNVFGMLANVQGYPQVNEQGESALRYAL